VQEIYVESRQMQFLYQTDNSAVFMDPQTYQQQELNKQILGDKSQFLVPELEIYVLFYQEKPLSIRMPPKVTMTVDRAQSAVAGDRSNAGTKPVTMETGLKVQVPLFIEQGEELIIDTESGEYVSRA
jgi:elongation factor P